MNIPNIVLEAKNIIPNSTFNFIQNFAKDLIKAGSKKKKKKPKSNSTFIPSSSDCIIPQLTPSEMQKTIINWFFSLDINKRILICSIQNKWLVHIIYQLYQQFDYDYNVIFDTTIYMREFFPKKDYSNLNYKIYFSQNDKQTVADLNFFSTFFYPLDRAFPLDWKGNTQRNIENQFINFIRFISVDEYNDTITLDYHLIESRLDFKLKMENFTNGEFLRQWILPIYQPEYKNYIFPFASWTQSVGHFTLVQIITMYIEQSILLNFEYEYYAKSIYDLPYANKIKEILKDNLMVENFIKEESLNGRDCFIKRVKFEDIVKELNESKEKIEIIEKYKQLNNRIFQHYYNSKTIKNREERKYFDEAMKGFIEEQRESFDRGIERFVYELTFVSIERIYREKDFMGKQTFAYIYKLVKMKDVNELLSELQNCDKSGKKKKKKKKKKKTSEGNIEVKDAKEGDEFVKENKKEEIKEIVREEINSSSNSKSNSDIKKEEDVKDVSIVEEESSNIKRENKKKERKFYLYSVLPEHKKKNQKKKDNKKKDSNTKNTPSTNNTQSETTSSSTPKDQEITSSTFTPPPIIKQDATHYSLRNFPPQNFQLPFPQDSIFYYPPNHPFFSKLSKDIISYYETVEFNTNYLKPTRLSYLNNLKNSINDSLQTEYNLDIIIYGSFSTDLTIESSDIDILIQYKEKNPQFDDNNNNNNNNYTNIYTKKEITLIRKFNFFLNKNQKENFDYINPIFTASVPVLKLQQDISKDLPQNIKTLVIFENYMFSKDDLNKIKFDITFKEKDAYSSKISAKDTVDFVKKTVLNFPEIKPLFLILKRYMKMQNMNNSFEGGISSYSLFLLILAFIKVEKRENCQNKEDECGRELYDFFRWYANFNFEMYVIKPGEENPFVILNGGKNEQIVIFDPLTNLNVSQSSFKVDKIKYVFKKGFEFLRNVSFQMGNQTFCMNIVYNLLFLEK